jgi:hypothetical protein
MKPGLRIAVTVMFVCGAISHVAAQDKKPPKPPPPPKPAAAGKPNGAGKPAGGAGKAFNPAKELDEFSKMSPEDREKELQKLPPGRRTALQKRFEHYQQMTPEQQERFKESLGIMHGLPPQRQNAVRQAIQELRDLPPARRKKVLESDAIKENFSGPEQKVILNSFPNIQKQMQKENPEPEY